MVTEPLSTRGGGGTDLAPRQTGGSRAPVDPATTPACEMQAQFYQGVDLEHAGKVQSSL